MFVPFQYVKSVAGGSGGISAGSVIGGRTFRALVAHWVHNLHDCAEGSSSYHRTGGDTSGPPSHI